jgi:uroporphyrinogen decarboxylase
MMRDHLNLPVSDDPLNQVLDYFDVDLRWVGLPFIGPPERSAPTLWGEGFDFWGVGYTKIQNATNTYFDINHHPLAQAKTVADVENYDWPSLDWWDYSALLRLIEQINHSDRRAIVFFAGGAFETPWYIRGLEQFLVDLYTAPEIRSSHLPACRILL